MLICYLFLWVEFSVYQLLYLHVKGPMGGAPYIGPRLGGGPIFKIPLSQLDVKERPENTYVIFII